MSHRSIAIAYGIAGLSAAVATIAVVAALPASPAPQPMPEPVEQAWSAPVAAQPAVDPSALAGLDVSQQPTGLEPELVYVDERGRPVAAPSAERARSRWEDDDDDDDASDDHERREHAGRGRGRGERDDD